MVLSDFRFQKPGVHCILHTVADMRSIPDRNESVYPVLPGSFRNLGKPLTGVSILSNQSVKVTLVLEPEADREINRRFAPT